MVGLEAIPAAMGRSSVHPRLVVSLSPQLDRLHDENTPHLYALLLDSTVALEKTVV